MATAKRKRWTLEEFLAFDDGTDTRYELIDGERFAMAPPARAHGTLVMRLGRMIAAGLTPPCEVIGEAGIILTDSAENYYQADLAVTCTQGPLNSPIIPQPVVIAEVLSPSTARTDRDRKVPDYRTIPSVKDILVVSSDDARVEHLFRDGDGWRLKDVMGQGTIRLTAIDIPLDIGELYAGLDFTADRSAEAGDAQG